jgi:cellulose synthase/poly-beta-1,6-N-acetylglucosamine synthase-like glycosyltransferase
MAYTYLGYPIFIAILAQFFPRRRYVPDFLPFISVLIAAHNEEQDIEWKLKETLNLDYPADKMEVLVLSDASTDRTDAIVKSFADPRVRLVRPQHRLGKTGVQNFGVSQARGEVLFFSDATTHYHRMALRFMASNYIDPRVGAVGGRNMYFDATGSPTGAGTIAFWNYENQVKCNQSRIHTITGCSGSIYSVRKSVYTALPDDIISDLVQPLMVVRQGYRVIFEDRAIGYEDTTHTTREEFRMRVRVITRGMRGLLSVPDLLNPLKRPWIALQLLSHKVLRWLAPFELILLLLLSGLLAGASVAMKFVFLGQLVFYLWALFSSVVHVERLFRPAAIPLYFCTLNLAALASMVEVVRGKRYVVWETVRNASAPSH